MKTVPSRRRASAWWLSTLMLGAAAPAPPAASPGREWRHGGDPGHTQYSELAQINAGNVQRMRQAWIYRTGDKRNDDRSQIQCQPIVVEGVLYGTSPAIKLFALEAATGK